MSTYKLPDLWAQELPPDYPSLNWIRTFSSYKICHSTQEISNNIVNVMSMFIKLHKTIDYNKTVDINDIPVESRKILHIFCMEMCMLNRHTLGNEPEFIKLAKSTLHPFTKIENPPLVKLDNYLEYFEKMIFPEKKLEAKRRYIAFLFSRILCNVTSKCIANHYTE